MIDDALRRSIEKEIDAMRLRYAESCARATFSGNNFGVPSHYTVKRVPLLTRIHCKIYAAREWLALKIAPWLDRDDC